MARNVVALASVLGHRAPQRPPSFISHSSAPHYKQQIPRKLRATLPTLINEA